MNPTGKKLNWKIAAAVGGLTGVAIGGFALAAPNDDDPTLPTTGVILQNSPSSVGRLSAPVVVPTTAAQLASAASVQAIPPQPPAAVEVSAPSPVIPAAPAPVPAAVPAPQPIAAPPVAPPPPPAVASAGSPVSVASVASPASPASPSSPGSGGDS